MSELTQPPAAMHRLHSGHSGLAVVRRSIAAHLWSVSEATSLTQVNDADHDEDLCFNVRRSLASTLGVGVAGTVVCLRTSWTKHDAYRKMLAALRDVPTLAVRDLDSNRRDLAAIAHRKVYGHSLRQ